MKNAAFKQSRAICWIGLMLCLAGGCVRSIQPILKDDQVITDDRLLGSWVSSDGTGHGEITPGDTPKSYKLRYIDDKDGKVSEVLIRVGKVGDMTLAQSTIAGPPTDSGDLYNMHLLPVYCFALIKEMSPTRIVIKMMDDDWLGKYVKAHPDELATTKVDKDSLLITATTDDLQAFLIRHEKDDGAYGDDGLFVRPGDPTTRPTTTPATNAAP
jgi:hypothetical protein